MSCGKNTPEVSIPSEPSFATFHIRDIGVPSNFTQSPTLLNAEILIEGCSQASDNRQVVIKKISKRHLENLTKLSTGCVASLLSITAPGENGPELYLPDKNSSPMPIIAGNTALYISTKNNELIAVAEVGLSNNLQRFENVVLAIFPPQKENRLPVGSLVEDFRGKSPLPDIVPAAMSFEGVLEKKNAYSFYFECGAQKLGDTCGDFNLSAIKMRFLDTLPNPRSKENLTNLVNELGPQITPNTSHYYGNGIRINVATTTSRGSEAGFIVSLGDSLRLFTLKLP
jgi:predicted small lipoprotein YifL